MADQNYTVVARRYRPKQFADLVGQEPVARALTNALNADRVAHAYLFTGARGVGKTSTARILAKALNCVTGPTPTPCDRCDICTSIASGEDIDVLEIDGASNRGIDEVRAIRQNVNTRPSRGRHKIYIIDEVHMLTGPAFNALLKTLEEPPPHVKFIFATTEVQKIPVTILSRCQRFDFAGIGTSRIAECLRGVVEAEGMKADPEALQLVARRAGGSMRDAQSLLDQLLAFSSDALTVDIVHRLLGTAADDRVTELAGSVLNKDVGSTLKQLTTCADDGLQLGELLDQLIEYWAALMRVNAAGDWPELPVSDAHRDTLVTQARQLSLDSILAGLDILTTTKNRLRFSNHPLVLLEMALIRLARLEDLVTLPQLVKMLTEAPPTASPRASSAGDTIKKTIPERAEPARLGAHRNGSTPHVNGTTTTPPIMRLTTENLPQVWEKVLASLGGMFRGQVEKSGLPAIIGPKTLRIHFPNHAQLAYDHCREPERVAALEKAILTQTGEPWTLKLELESASLASGDDRTALVQPHNPGTGDRKRTLEIPLIRQAIVATEAKLVKFDPGFGEGFETEQPQEQPRE